MRKKRHTTLLMADQDIRRLERLARQLGYMQTRGTGAGRIGSVSALMGAIAQGTVFIKHIRKHPEKPDAD
jgi:hypothetical protein